MNAKRAPLPSQRAQTNPFKPQAINNPFLNNNDDEQEEEALDMDQNVEIQ